jgi:AhpD family alkylhydroperoxidase
LVYIQGMEALSQGELTPRQQQAVALTVSTANGCHYCQAAHWWLGAKVGISREDLKAIRQGLVPAADEVAKVVRASRVILEKKGWLESADLQELERQGLNRTQLYEIVALIGLKTISNYVNHMAHTTVDAQFKA